MRYRTFRNGVLLGAGSVTLVFAVFIYKTKANAPPAPPPAPVPVPAPAPAPDAVPVPAPAPAPVSFPAPTTVSVPDASEPDPDAHPLRPLDRKILGEIVGKPIPEGKEKDLYPDSPELVSVYADAPSTIATRIKIDLDRDGKYDEKWELDGTQVTKRLVSTRDDEVYDEVWRLDGDRWVRVKSGLAPPPPPPKPATTPAATTPLGSLDREVLALLGQPARGDKKKDALGKTGPKVNLYALGGSSVWNHAKIDLERNNKWNEKWDWKDGKVTRQVAPNDDEVYTKKYKLKGDAWVESEN